MIKFSLDFIKDKKQKAILMGLISAIVLVLYFNLLLKPQVGWVVASVIKANKISSDFKNAKADIANIDKFKSDIAVYKDRIDRYEKMLPAEQEIPALLEELSNMAKKANVKIAGITPMVKKLEAAPRSQFYQEMPILISAESGYHEFGTFLANLENCPRFMKVVDIEIKSDKTKARKHGVELVVLTYMLAKGK